MPTSLLALLLPLGWAPKVASRSESMPPTLCSRSATAASRSFRCLSLRKRERFKMRAAWRFVRRERSGGHAVPAWPVIHRRKMKQKGMHANGIYLSLTSPLGLAAPEAGLPCCFAAFLGLDRLSTHACLQATCRWRHTTGGTAARRALVPASSGNRLSCGQVMLWVGE